MYLLKFFTYTALRDIATYKCPTMPPGLSDLVLDTQIRVEFDSEVVYRFTFESVRVSRKYARRQERRQAWKEQRLLGGGSFGDVYLHQCSSSANETQLQAVKTIDKARMAKEKIDFYKEIEAIAKFSQQKVRHLAAPTWILLMLAK